MIIREIGTSSQDQFIHTPFHDVFIDFHEISPASQTKWLIWKMYWGAKRLSKQDMATSTTSGRLVHMVYYYLTTKRTIFHDDGRHCAAVCVIRFRLDGTWRWVGARKSPLKPPCTFSAATCVLSATTNVERGASGVETIQNNHALGYYSEDCWLIAPCKFVFCRRPPLVASIIPIIQKQFSKQRKRKKLTIFVVTLWVQLQGMINVETKIDSCVLISPPHPYWPLTLPTEYESSERTESGLIGAIWREESIHPLTGNVIRSSCAINCTTLEIYFMNACVYPSPSGAIVLPRGMKHITICLLPVIFIIQEVSNFVLM